MAGAVCFQLVSTLSQLPAYFRPPMTATQLKELESRLWAAADQLRANSKLTATEYSFPVLELLFLRHAFRRFNDVKTKI